MSLKAEEDASGLVAALEGGVFAARVQAARVLWWLASECPDIVLPFLPHLVAALKDNCRDVRKWAAGALCKVAKKRPNAIASHVSALVSALDDNDKGVRCRVAGALAHFALGYDKIGLKQTRRDGGKRC